MKEGLTQFRLRREVAIIGNNALKLDLQPQIRPHLVPNRMADVVDFQAFKDKKVQNKRAESGSALVYDPDFDTRDYANFHSLTPEKQQELIDHTRRQLATYVGERLNVVESKTRWNIVNGELIPQGRGVSLEKLITNGIEWRRSINPKTGNLYGNPLDFEREEAELIGARKTTARFTSPDAKIGTMEVVISPRGKEGSDYKHKFFDVRFLREDENGPYLEVTRYLSNLDTYDYVGKLAPFETFDSRPTDADFLANPIDVTGAFDTPEEVQTYLSKGVKALSAEIKAQIDIALEPLYIAYFQFLIRYPDDIYGRNRKLNAILNGADDMEEAFEVGYAQGFIRTRHYSSFTNDVRSKSAIHALEEKKVKNKIVPCPGSSGGFDTGSDLSKSTSPFSVSEYGSDKKQWFSCPKCHYKADGPVGNTCPGCGLTKEKYAKDGGKTC